MPSTPPPPRATPSPAHSHLPLGAFRLLSLSFPGDSCIKTAVGTLAMWTSQQGIHHPLAQGPRLPSNRGPQGLTCPSLSFRFASQ